ncbi:MAG TPA: hypothetical protein VLI04_06515 [Nocardioidaceae bacterium]|nr:hypothetical protein [Nocardioidaceae bacterium]
MTTTIWMDPVELTASSATLGELGMRIQETMTGTRTTCSCEVPRSLVAWIDEELLAITVAALQVAVGYLQEAVDCRQRAVALQAEQSLAMSQSTTMTIGGPQIFDNWMTIGGPSTVGGYLITSGVSTQSVLPGYAVVGGKPTYENMPFLQDRFAGLWNNPGNAAAMTRIMDIQNDSIRTTLAPNGLTYERGAYVDSGGDRSTSLAGQYRDPVTGRYDLD